MAERVLTDNDITRIKTFYSSLEASHARAKTMLGRQALTLAEKILYSHLIPAQYPQAVVRGESTPDPPAGPGRHAGRNRPNGHAAVYAVQSVLKPPFPRPSTAITSSAPNPVFRKICSGPSPKTPRSIISSNPPGPNTASASGNRAAASSTR